MVDTGRRRSTAERIELAELGVYLLIVIGSLFWIPRLIQRGWFSGDPGHLTRAMLTAGEPYGISLLLLQAVAVGCFIGLLAVLLLDKKKKVHAALLMFGTFAIGHVLIEQVNFVPRLVNFWTLEYAAPVLLGVLASVLVCLWPVTPMQLLDRNRSLHFEFRRGAKIAASLTVVSLVMMVFEATVIYPSVAELVAAVFDDSNTAGISFRTEYLLWDVAVVTALSWTLLKFVRYDRSTTPFVLGPSGAGKTYFMLGAFFEDRQTDAARTHSASTTLTRKANGLEQEVRAGNEETWHVPNTDSGNTELLEYTRESGQTLPRDVTVQSLDYAGENLAGLGMVLEEDLSLAEATNSDLPPGANIDDVKKIKARIKQADTLIFMLDAKVLFGDSRLVTDGGKTVFEREESATDTSGTLFEGTESSLHDLAYYEPVLAEYGENKRVVFAVTKADVLDAEYHTHYGIDIYDRTEIDRFATLLTEELRHQDLTAALLEQAGTTEVYPVYFRTTLNEHGNRVPVRPKFGPLLPFGFTRLMEDL